MINRKLAYSRFYIGLRSQTTGYHSVHKDDCPFLPEEGRRIYLGRYCHGDDPASEAKKYFEKVNKCSFCMKDHCEDEFEPVSAECDSQRFLPTKSQITNVVNGAIFYFIN